MESTSTYHLPGNTVPAADEWTATVQAWLSRIPVASVTVVLCDATAAHYQRLRSDIRVEDLIRITETADGFVVFQPMVGNTTGAADAVAHRLGSLVAAAGVGYALKSDDTDSLTDLLAAARASAVADREQRSPLPPSSAEADLVVERAAGAVL